MNEPVEAGLCGKDVCKWKSANRLQRQIATLGNSQNLRRLSAALSNLACLEQEVGPGVLQRCLPTSWFYELHTMRHSPSSYHRLLSRASFTCPLVLTVVFLHRAQEGVDAQNKVHYRFSSMRIMAFFITLIQYRLEGTESFCS